MLAEPSGALPLDQDHSEVLLALAAAFQRAQMYPEGHPTLDKALNQFAERLAHLLSRRIAVQFAVTPTQLFVGRHATDPGHPMHRDLAARLFRRNIGTIRLSPGITRAEVADLLRVVTQDDGELMTLSSPRMSVEPLDFGSMALDADPGATLRPPPGMHSEIWTALAGAMLGAEAVAGESAAPGEALAAGFDALPPDPVRDGVVIMHLHQAASASRDRFAPQSVHLRRQISRLIRELRPDTLERLLGHGGADHAGHHLVRDLAQMATATATLDVVLASARSERRELSPPMVRLLGKLADHAEKGGPAERRMAAEQFLGLVHELLSGWEAPHPAVVEPLEHLPTPIVPGLSPRDAYRSDPYRLLTMQLDMGTLGASAERAVDTLVSRGQVKPLVDLMGQLPAGDPLTHAYRPILVGAGALDRVLAATPVDVETVERLAPEVGPAAIPALLDALAASSERSLRRRLLEVLAHFGNLVTPEVLTRLRDAPWYVQRNLLRLLQMLPDPGVEAVAMEFSRHSDPRVRVEGFRLLMRHPGARARGIVAGLSDPDSSGVRVAVQAAGEDCPPGAAPLLVEGLREGRIDAGLRPAAIRALGPMVDEPGVLDLLIGFAARKLPLFGWRIAAKTKESLAALAALARHWSADPRAAAIVARARRHADADVREAVSP